MIVHDIQWSVSFQAMTRSSLYSVLKPFTGPEYGMAAGCGSSRRSTYNTVHANSRSADEPSRQGRRRDGNIKRASS